MEEEWEWQERLRKGDVSEEEKKARKCRKLLTSRYYYVYRKLRKGVSADEKKAYEKDISEIDQDLRGMGCPVTYPKEFYVRLAFQPELPHGLVIKVYAEDEKMASDVGEEIWWDYGLDPPISGEISVETPEETVERRKKSIESKARSKKEVCVSCGKLRVEFLEGECKACYLKKWEERWEKKRESKEETKQRE